MKGAILESVLDRDKTERKTPACLCVWLLWATCIAWAAQRAAKDGREAQGLRVVVSSQQTCVSTLMRRLQPVGQLLLIPLHILGVRGAWALAQLYAADLKCHLESCVKYTKSVSRKGREGRDL